MKKSEAKQLRVLVEQWTRAEIMARFGTSHGLEFGDYAQLKFDIEEEMRKLVFGSDFNDNLVELGIHLGILKEREPVRRKKKKKKKRKQNE